MSLQTPDIGERNVERLLSAAYRPETMDPGFVQETQDKLLAASRELALARRQTVSMTRIPDYTRLRHTLGWAMALAAAVACFFLIQRASRMQGPRISDNESPALTRERTTFSDASFASRSGVGLIPRARVAAPETRTLKAGETVATKPGEKRRLLLGDGTVLYVNQGSQLKQTAARHIELTRGEIYLEVSPSESGAGATFVVDTPGRKVSALGTRFSVQADPKGAGVLVTQGKVQVSGIDRPLTTGEQLITGSTCIASAPRATHELDWTKDLMAAAESPLVPGAQHGGGALLAVDPFGQEVRLTMRKYHIDVHIEDGFARTTIDQTYFNNETWRLEGTFYFPLPPDASLSRLAMYVEDGDSSKLNEGGMAERNHARNVYEEIVHSQRDPALLEWVDGSTFKMRVFPLEGRKEKRIVLSYTQRLPSLYGTTRYRFPTGHSMELVRDWSFHARVKHGADLRITSPSHPDAMTIAANGGDMLLNVSEKDTKPEKDVVLEILDGTDDRDLARFNSGVHEKHQYLMLRYRPDLKTEGKIERRDWVILFEAGANRDPLLARTQIEVVKNLLENAEHDDTFTLLTANTRVHFFDKEPRPLTPKNVEAALAWLDTTHLIGALDLKQALEAAKPALGKGKNPHLVHVGAGVPALGERDDATLAKNIPAKARYVGIGVGKKWNRAFMKIAAERSGGYFAQINPDEPIAWKTFELLATLNTPRLMDLRVVDAAEKVVFLSESLALAEGEEVCAIARIDASKGEKMPKQVIVSGKLDGKAFAGTLNVEKVQAGADYLPRTWAKLEIDRLLADGAEKNKETITKLSMASYVMSPFTSLLVLETEADYVKFKVDRGRKDHWALYPCPDRIPTVFEPDVARQAWLAPADAEGKKPKEHVLATILLRPTPRFLQVQGRAGNLPAWVTALQVYQGAHAVPQQTNEWRFLRSSTEWMEREELSTEGLLDLRLSLKGQTAAIPPFGRDFNKARRLLFLEDREKAKEIWPNDEQGWLGGRRIQFAPVFANPRMQWATRGAVRASPERLEPERLEEAKKMYREVALNLAREEWGTLPLRERGEFGEQLRLIDELPHRGMLMSQLELPLSPRHFDFKQPMVNVNGIEFFPPSLALTARAPTRLHTSIIRGSIGGKFSRTELFAMDDSGSMAIGMGTGTMATYARSKLFIEYWDIDEMGRPFVDMPQKKELDPESEQRWLFADFLAARTTRSSPGQHLIYSRPRFQNEQRLFGDLTLYAPGLQTSWADIEATLEREAKRETPLVLGSIDEEARKLIERARSAGWETITIDDAPLPFQVTYNGLGHFQYERVLSTGLREEVVGNGNHLWHLYPEIGLAGQRFNGRHYFDEIAGLVPWLLPSVDELARAGDVKRIDDNVIALVPHWAAKIEKDETAVHLHLVFEKDRLTERRLVEVPSGRVLMRVTYDADGIVRVLNEGERVVSEQRLGRVQTSAPSLTPDTDDLLVVRFPVRTSQHLYVSMKTNRSHASKMSKALAEDLFVAHCFGNDGHQALGIFAERFHSKEDRRLGFYTLLNACAVPISPGHAYAFFNGTQTTFDVVKEHPESPLARYLDHNQAILQGRNPAPDVGELSGSKESFLNRLGRYRDLATMWSRGQMGSPGTDEFKANGERTIRDLKDCDQPLWAWAVLERVQQRASSTEFQLALGEVLKEMGERTGLLYSARYQHASSLYSAGKWDEAKRQFLALHEDAFQQGIIPPIDGIFRNALNHNAPEGALPFGQFLRERHERLLKDGRPLAALRLAWQAHQLGETGLAGEFFLATINSAREEERNLMRLAGLEFLWHTSQYAYADTILQTVLEDEVLAESPVIWRLAAQIAQRRGMLARQVTAQEKAMDLEYAELPEIVNLQAVRQEYGNLLEQYSQMAAAFSMVEREAPKDLIAKVIKTADRWRSLDPDNMDVPQRTARILRMLGSRELAWDYLTTPIGMKPGEAEPWVRMAQELKGEAEFELADRAYQAAVRAEPTNAQILWDRAQNLQAMGRMADARAVFARISDGEWQPRFRWIQQQAKGLR